ncbi:sensor histidine kinase [Lewinella sp. IMCC34191]|uniref:sensor histidine kinase n=1 Tax=Lewinella sp. IMCC34191 TaxID=2259172 RepID=UPI001300BA7B|nr:sensor histidine kinase [Lewinella sp. IMCC34191]
MSQDSQISGSDKSYRLFRVVFVGLALLTVIVLASVIPELTAIDVRKKLDNALTLEQDLSELLSIVQNAEAGQRGYLLTGDPEYLQPYIHARQGYDAIIKDLAREVSLDNQQLNRVQRVRLATEIKFAELDTTLSLFRQGDTTALQNVMDTNEGLHAMDSIRHLVGLLRNAEMRDIRVRQAQLAQLSTVTTILRFLGVVGLGLVFYYIYSQVRPLFDTITSSNGRLKEENTERRRVEKKNHELIASLNAKNSELDQFAYMASHDLREPLRTVSNYIEVLGEDYAPILDDAGREHLSTIHRATDRMRSLIETLLTYSRIGRSEEPRELCLAQPVREALENLALRVEESEARIEIGELPTIKGYPVALRQLFQNLLANAIKFHRAGEPPRIEIQGKTEGNKVRITIRDHGIGINKADQDKIFQLFTRLDSSQMREGQGIGLAFCQKIVQLHQGTLAVRSEPGLGSTFIVILPSSLRNDEARVHYAN